MVLMAKMQWNTINAALLHDTITKKGVQLAGDTFWTSDMLHKIDREFGIQCDEAELKHQKKKNMKPYPCAFLHRDVSN